MEPRNGTTGADSVIEVEAPDGSIVEFPSGTPDEQISAVMAKEYPPTFTGGVSGTWEEYGPIRKGWEGFKNWFRTPVIPFSKITEPYMDKPTIPVGAGGYFSMMPPPTPQAAEASITQANPGVMHGLAKSGEMLTSPEGMVTMAALGQLPKLGIFGFAAALGIGTDQGYNAIRHFLNAQGLEDTNQMTSEQTQALVSLLFSAGILKHTVTPRAGAPIPEGGAAEALLGKKNITRLNQPSPIQAPAESPLLPAAVGPERSVPPPEAIDASYQFDPEAQALLAEKEAMFSGKGGDIFGPSPMPEWSRPAKTGEEAAETIRGGPFPEWSRPARTGQEAREGGRNIPEWLNPAKTREQAIIDAGGRIFTRGRQPLPEEPYPADFMDFLRFTGREQYTEAPVKMPKDWEPAEPELSTLASRLPEKGPKFRTIYTGATGINPYKVIEEFGPFISLEKAKASGTWTEWEEGLPRGRRRKIFRKGKKYPGPDEMMERFREMDSSIETEYDLINRLNNWNPKGEKISAEDQAYIFEEQRRKANEEWLEKGEEPSTEPEDLFRVPEEERIKEPGEEGFADFLEDFRRSRAGFINPGGEITMMPIGQTHYTSNFVSDRIRFRKYPDGALLVSIVGKPDRASIARLKEMAEETDDLQWEMLTNGERIITHGDGWRSLIHQLGSMGKEEGFAKLSDEDRQGFNFEPLEIKGQSKEQGIEELIKKTLGAKDSGVSKRDLLNLKKKKKKSENLRPLFENEQGGLF